MSKPLFAVIAAMQPELDYLLTHLKYKEEVEVGAIRFYIGEINEIKIVLALSGIGKVNAAITTAIAIERFMPDYVINTGSAAGLKQGLNVGDVVIGCDVAHHDVDVTAFGYEAGQVPQLPPRFKADNFLILAAKNAVHVFSGSTVHQGLIVSGDQFVCSAEQISAIKNKFNDVVAVEMEAAAIAQTCHQLNTPFVIIRAISDNGDEHATISFDDFLQVAGKNSAKMVVNLIGTDFNFS